MFNFNREEVLWLVFVVAEVLVAVVFVVGEFPAAGG